MYYINRAYQCDLCGAKKYKALFQINTKLIVACPECRLVSYHPLATPDELSSIYNDSQYFEAEYFKVDDKNLKTVHYRYFVETANLAQNHCNATHKILEIGPGKGDFVELCVERGLQIECMEFSEHAAKKLSEQFGCNVYHGDITYSDFQANSYKMIVAFDVIEHLLSPKIWLDAIFRVLEPDGFFIFNTVNVQNLLDRIGWLFYRLGIKGPIIKLYPSYHLYYFTPQILEKYLQKAGFEIVQVKQENYDYRKASSKLVEQSVLRVIYRLHDITGQKTNLYIIAKKPGI